MINSFYSVMKILQITAYEEDNPNRLVIGLGIGNAGTLSRNTKYKIQSPYHSIPDLNPTSLSPSSPPPLLLPLSIPLFILSPLPLPLLPLPSISSHPFPLLTLFLRRSPSPPSPPHLLPPSSPPPSSISVSALFGGFGGCGLIPNTLLNGNSGGEGYASSFAYSIFLGLFVVVLAPIIGKIPMASLAGKYITVICVYVYVCVLCVVIRVKSSTHMTEKLQ